MFTERKSSYKTPPTTITDKFLSQEVRRSKALEEQKRRRAQKVDSARQLDIFADLSLGASDDEGEVAGLNNPEIPHGIASFASMLEATPSDDHPHTAIVTSKTTSVEHVTGAEALRGGKKRSKNKRKARTKADKPNKWADKCMYAELLEMNEGDGWSALDGRVVNDGLPDDLESGWVAVAPVPVGKRCLAVTHQSSGLGGVVPNTTLRSRMLGKSLIARFPSWLPPLTILDCILDPNWRVNGILHVLDVIQWKGQDVGDCEARFRFWWRDTRLAELPRSPPPSASIPFSNTFPSPSNGVSKTPPTITSIWSPETGSYRFPYPTTFLAIPYHTDTTLLFLSSHVIPLARSSRSIAVDIPVVCQPASSEGIMDVDASVITSLRSRSVDVKSDGLLLYVAQASYEPGTSPLSSWIPITSYSEDGDNQYESHRGDDSSCAVDQGPLDLFERLVNRRITDGRRDGVVHREITMDMDT